MDQFTHDEPDESMLDAFRSIGESKIDFLKGVNIPALEPLGEDNFELMSKSRTETLKKSVQVDLSNPDNLNQLEDPRLVEHMRAARAMNANRETNMPCRDDANRAAKIHMSQVSSILHQQQMATQCMAESTLLQCENIRKIIDGVQPYGYPSVNEGTGPMFNFLEKKLRGAAEEAMQVGERLKDLEREFMNARRNYDAALDAQ